MTWISLVCLLALSGTVFSRSVPFAVGGGYGGYGGAALLPVAPKVITSVSRPAVISTGYGGTTEVITPSVQPLLPATTITKVLPTGGYGGGFSRAFLDQPATTIVEPANQIVGPATTVVGPGPGPTVVTGIPVQPMTQADVLCRGQLPETVIPLDGGIRFVVCLDDSKGTEQFCPKGLIYVEALRRCERRTGPFDACSSAPCLNGGGCLNTEYSYHCQCAPGFDGKNCELDARTCQTQQPCGLGPDARCQSFRWGAALDYICVFQDGAGYGLSPAQIHTSPCVGVDGPHALAFTNLGFIMCDGERTFFESCPGGTVWEDINKACVWPDMQFEVAGYGQRTLIAKTGYGAGYGASVVVEPKPVVATRVLEPVRPVVSGYGGPAYGGETIVTKTLEPVRPVLSGYGGPAYGGETIVTKTLEPVRPVLSGYGGETIVTKTLEPVRPLISSYGGPSYGGPAIATRVHVDQPRVISSYGGPREDVIVKTGY